MRPSAPVLWTAVLTLGLSAAGLAQERPGRPSDIPLTVGSRVRLLTNTIRDQVHGVVVAVDGEALTVAPEAATPLKLSFDSITALDVRVGQKRNTLKGLGIGLLAGVALGLAMPVDANDCGEESSNFCSRGEALGGATILFGGLGAGIGALVKSDRWAPVVLDVRRPASARGPAVGVALTVSF